MEQWQDDVGRASPGSPMDPGPALLRAATRRVRDDLLVDGYSVTSAAALGFGRSTESIARRFFRADVLEPESNPNTFPPDRWRARDVVRYQWRNDDAHAAPLLTEHDDIVMATPVGLTGRHPHQERREYRRVRSLRDRTLATVAERMLGLVPVERRYVRGTFALNFLRTHTSVVSGPHQDGEPFVFIYVVDKDAVGGVTTLYPIGSPGRRILDVELRPGQLLVFDDARFLHDVSPLRPREGAVSAARDALICTVNRPESYSW